MTVIFFRTIIVYVIMLLVLRLMGKRQIGELHRGGKSVDEIATLLKMTRANANSYLPYEGVIYNMEERSVAADRQARYRKRKKEKSQVVE